MTIPAGFIPEEEFKESESISIPEGFVPEASEKRKQVAESFKVPGWKPKAESIETIRHGVGSALRGAAQGLGSIGELINLALPKKGSKRYEEAAKGFAIHFGPNNEIWKPKPESVYKAMHIVPDSQTIGNFFDKTAGEDFSPKNVPEQFINLGMDFLTSMLTLGGGAKAGSAVKSFGKNLMRAFVPAGVNVMGQEAGLPDWLNAANTIGASLLTHKFTSDSLPKIANQWHEHARELGKDTLIDVRPAMEKLEKFKEAKVNWRLDTDPVKKFLNNAINDVEKKFIRNVIPANEWAGVNTSLNSFAPEASELVGGKKLLGQVKSIVQGLDEQLKFRNPEYLKAYRQANSLTKGIYESRFIENFIKKHPKLAASSGLVTGLLKYANIGNIPGMGGIGAGAGAVKVGQIVSALYRNPGLRKAYFEVLRHAAAENPNMTLKALKEFNSVAEKNGISLENEGL